MHIERRWILPCVLRRLTLQRFDLAKQGNGLGPAGTISEPLRQLPGAQPKTLYIVHDCGARCLLSGDRRSALEVRPESFEGLDEILSKRCDTLLIPLQFRRARQRDCGKNERRQQQEKGSEGFHRSLPDARA
jgi:hypothetical protein